MKRTPVKLAALILLLVLPFSIFAIYTEALPDQYQNTYLAQFANKYDRLYETEGKKIILIGGSSLPFGLRSDLIEEELGGDYTVVNFGLYATLGTKFMMDTAKKAIAEDDIVILCPELFTQTYSLYFNPEAVLQATDGASDMLAHLPPKDQLSLFYNYYKFAFDKIEYAKTETTPDPIGIYRADSFNEYGDIEVEREHNIMNNAYDENMLIVTDDTLLDQDFIDYVNDYVQYAENLGATIYFNYSPTNASAIRSSRVAREAFEKKLAAALDCELLGSIEDYLIDERYFYDTNFHLNSAGAVYFSRLLSLDLKEKLGLEVSTALEIPTPPELPTDAVVEVDKTEETVPFEEYRGEPNVDYVDWFEYEAVGGSYKIVGVKDEFLGMTEVILPSVYNGANVTAVAENAFVGCTDLKAIHVGKTFKSLEIRAFYGCISLEGVYLYEQDGNKLSPSATGLLDGCAPNAKLFISKDANYSVGYTWSNYTDRFDTFD